MLAFPSFTSIKLLVAVGLLTATVPAALARGGAPGGPPGLGVAGPGPGGPAPGLGTAGYGRGPAGIYARGGGRFAGVGPNHFGRGRFDARRSYYPSAPFGPFGGFYDGYPASTGTREAPYVDTAPRTVTIIQRGPAFGEPGYTSHPVIYRLTPATPRTAGVRRYKVDRLDF